jgi:hypothetical protein
MSLHGELLDFKAFREQRAAEKVERRRENARRNLSPMAPDYGREIPPRINPDVPDMVDQINGCYFTLTQAVEGFQEEIADLVDAGELAPSEGRSLQSHYQELVEAIDRAMAGTLRWNASGVSPCVTTERVHVIADHAKHVFAVGNRDIAALQYRLADFAHTGQLAQAANERLQWDHCLKMWETLYGGTVFVVRDDRTWDGGWDWSDNTYSDGRQIMSQVRVNDWEAIERDWTCGEIAGDGPWLEHPRGSICSIAPVEDPDKDHGRCHRPIEIDLEALAERVGMRALVHPNAESSVRGDQKKSG